MDTALNTQAKLGGLKNHWTRLTPMARLGRADDLNGVAVFLASDASRFVTGAHIYVDVCIFLDVRVIRLTLNREDMPCIEMLMTYLVRCDNVTK